MGLGCEVQHFPEAAPQDGMPSSTRILWAARAFIEPPGIGLTVIKKHSGTT